MQPNPTIDLAFAQFPTLTTQRLRLRHIELQDAEALFAIFSDAETMKFNGHPLQHSLDDAHAWIAQIETRYAQKEAIRWGITFRDEDKVIGTCSFHRFGPGYHRVETGYELNRAYWGQGIMVEAMSAVIAYGFTDLGMHRIEAEINILNERSKNLLLKLGFTYEGNLRERYVSNDGFGDEHYFGLLQHEWQKRD